MKKKIVTQECYHTESIYILIWGGWVYRIAQQENEIIIIIIISFIMKEFDSACKPGLEPSFLV